MKRALLFALTGAVLLGASPAAAAAAPAPAAAPASAQRVLIISLPDTDWRALTAGTEAYGCAPERACIYPNLRALLRGSGVADLSVPGVAYEPTVADAYLTISAGARAQSRSGNGDCTAGGGRITCTDLARIIRHNDDLLYDAHVGELGDTLADAGISRAVIGTPRAALALTGRDGSVPTATIDDFDRVWRDRSVVLVEAPSTGITPRFDREIGSLLERVDPEHDAVLVVGPAHGPLKLTVAGLRAKGMRPGLMRSAFTRHSGIVGIVDVAPTVLDVLGIEAPDHMEGRPFAFGRTGGDFDARLDWLVATDERSQFRDDAVAQVGAILAAGGFVLAGVALLLFATRRKPPAALQLGALALLFFLPATNLAVLLPFARWGLPAYWLFLVAVSVSAAAITYAACDRVAVTPLLVALGVIVGVIALDQLSGAHLQFNAAFGYSPTIGGRFAGLGNLGFAQLAAAALFLAGLIAHVVGGRRGAWLAIGVLALALLVDGAPLFGADVGGLLSMLPAFGVTAAMLLGSRFRWRLVALFGGATIVVVGIAAAVDLARPAEDRSHLGRLLAGDSDLGIVVQRKLASNLAVVTSTRATWILPIVYIAAAYLVWRSPGPIGVVRSRIRELNAALAGLAIVAVLGTLLNDSGIEITGMMFSVLVPVLVVLCARQGEQPAIVPDPARPREMSAT